MDFDKEDEVEENTNPYEYCEEDDDHLYDCPDGPLGFDDDEDICIVLNASRPTEYDDDIPF